MPDHPSSSRPEHGTDGKAAIRLQASVVDRATGALLGLAVGDALGATLEFSRRDTHPFHTEMTGGGPFHLRPGQWTDDTSMALALADSLICCRGFDPHDLMTRFLAWWQEGRYSCTGECFDIGTTTARALARFDRTGDPYAGNTSEDEAGNGSLMRLAPVALFCLNHENAADQLARDQSRVTHGAPQAVEACATFVQILRRAILGDPDPPHLPEWQEHAAICAIMAGAYRQKERDEISSSGYVVHTLEAALWCISQTTSFEEALVLAINLGGDADTVGAVTGQIAGATYGASAIPPRWLEKLAWREQIEAVTMCLLLGNERGP